jgi:hypothetical protein
MYSGPFSFPRRPEIIGNHKLMSRVDEFKHILILHSLIFVIFEDRNNLSRR